MFANVKEFYLNSNCNILIQRIISSGFKLKYDYDEFNLLTSYFGICERIAYSSFNSLVDDGLINEDFVPFFIHIIEKLNNIELTSFYKKIFSNKTIIETKKISLEECRACVLINSNGNLVPKILIPYNVVQTPYFYSIEAHEYGHFIQLLNRNDDDIYEYSEAISIFFEYLVYKEVYGEKEGYDVFINNKKNFLTGVAYDLMSFLNDYFECAKDENVSQEQVKPFIINCFSFFESFEYALNLIEIAKNDPHAVDELISKVIRKEETLDSYSHNNGFSTFLCKKMVKEFNL